MNFKESEDFYYSQNGEWVEVNENLVTTGITDFRLHQMGEVLYLDLPQEGKLVRQGEVVFSFESMTMIHDFIAPVTGTIIEVNQSLYDDPGILNDAPFDQGWLVVIEMENEKDLAILMRSKGYKHQIGIKMSFPRLDVYESPTKEVLDV